ncbi:LolA family protein [Flocculibacter collagenilyticus]|uniref:LolA family protein n=1 Tax=Flocculibacter collagenilyticus TaxID=2744479 RepID=UPI0018F4B0AF|nr:outer membrane lipoprotein carrier protein LolA [Flocculibacter collagenilyticus]
MNCNIAVAASLVVDLNQSQAISAAQASKKLALVNTTTASRGTFVQSKYFPILKKPIIASGEFYLTDTAFTWKTLQPVKSALIFKNNQLWEQVADGELSVVKNAANMTSILQNAISGNFIKLTKQFEFYEIKTPLDTDGKNTNEKNTDDACVVMLPLIESLKQGITQFVLCGKGQINTLSWTDPYNNRTDIQLSYLTPSETTKINEQ